MNSKGFSLIELLVSITIMGIISGIVFTGYRQMGRSSFLEDEANTIISGIEEVRGTSISATEMTEGGDQVQYFTINFEDDSYILFKDTDQSERSYQLEGGVEIKEGAGQAVGFIPPEPKVIFLDSDLENEIYEDQKCMEITVNYAEEPEDEDLVIRINRVGLIQMDNEQICD